MSDTKKTLISDNTPNLQRDQEPKIVQRFPSVTPEPAAVAATEALAETANAQPSEETPLDDKTKERKERAAAFKRAADIEARAMQMQKVAEEKLKKAQHFEEVTKKFQEDPTSVAEVFGLSREEFLRKYQNHVLNIKDEPREEVLDPVEEMKKRMDSLEQERQKEREQQSQLQYQLTKTNYIASNITPVLADKEKFRFLHRNGLEESSSYLYDLMNDHYTKTGEELSVADVAEVAESKLKELFLSKMNSLKENGLLDEYLGVEKKEEPPPQLGNKTKPSRTLSDSWGNSSPAPVQRQRQSFLSREERLAKTAAALDALEKKN